MGNVVPAFQQLREPKYLGVPPTKEGSSERILEALRSYGVTVEEYEINAAEYSDFVNHGGYKGEFSGYYHWNQTEKSMEHYVVADLLQLHKSDIYIDIANQYSPAPIIYNRLFHCQTYKQDLDFPLGFHGDTIGGDAANMDIPDEFCTKLGLHCSFEHFEGESDMRFIREAFRVLKPGGSVVFAPLYMWEEYSILTEPDIAIEQNVAFEDDALLCGWEGYRNRHGRFYNPQKLKERVLDQVSFKAEFYEIKNSKEIYSNSYLSFALKLTKPR